MSELRRCHSISGANFDEVACLAWAKLLSKSKQSLRERGAGYPVLGTRAHRFSAEFDISSTGVDFKEAKQQPSTIKGFALLLEGWARSDRRIACAPCVLPCSSRGESVAVAH
jgi:hypothetical protein